MAYKNERQSMVLNSLGKKYLTDKCKHKYANISYLDIYEKYFEKNRFNIKTVLEIGVYKGSSLKMWKEYFPNATIYGIDINPNAKQYEEDRINIHIGDQTDINFLHEISSIYGGFDIIIDEYPVLQPKSSTDEFSSISAS
jgi:23S rRNA U2552 (ribose-2'-O)-methylase RlmE/FtsJ